jgi:hypothetical protein
MEKVRAVDPEQRTVTLTFDVRGLHVKVEEGRRLVVELPAIRMTAPLFTEAAIDAMVEAGITHADVDTEAEQLMRNLQALQLGRLLRARREP